ncbi:MAG: hypothetical protein IJ050_09100, partial [Clostridia bacterium]|nr:hypothetical protein [Clostridia bacterium]
NSKYFDKVHTCGAVWNYAALAVMFVMPLGISIAFNAWPSLSVIGKVLLTLVPLYWVTAIIEVVTYVPMLGAGGTYLSFVTGNISNLKLPCGLNAMENAKVRANTEEGEVITTIAIAVSSLTTTVIIAVGVLAFAPILPRITAEGSVFKAAFNNVLPALFGALGAGYFVKHWRLAFAPVIVGVIVLVFAPETGVGILMFITIVASLVGAALIYKNLLSDALRSAKSGGHQPEEKE